MSEPAATPDTEAAPKPPSKLPLIGVLVVGLAIGAGTGAVVVGPMVVNKMGLNAPLVPAAKSSASHDAEGEEHGSEGAEGGEGEEAPADEHGEKKEGAAAPPVTLLENLVLNPASSQGTRYLLMSVAIESGDAAVVAQFTARDAELKDLILSALGNKTVEQLTDITAREGIKTELTEAIKKRFGKKAVKQLYFPQFVIQ
ncbi:MAG: flagellar basal body-associated FliL family protein [Gemmatimonas sp.]